jgi:hypothetical protein
MLQAGRPPVRVSIRWIFSIHLIFQPHYGPGLDSASNRDEYQESSWGVKGGRRVRLTNLSPSVSRSSKEKCVSLDVLQSYGSSRPVTGIALHIFMYTSSVRQALQKIIVSVSVKISMISMIYFLRHICLLTGLRVYFV